MAKDLFNKYIWLVDTIYQAQGITFKEINKRWLKSSISEGVDLPLKTFHNYRKAVEDMYGVKVTRVNTINYDGKRKSRYTKAGLITGRTNAYKKAMVTLAQGDTIDFYSNI